MSNGNPGPAKPVCFLDVDGVLADFVRGAMIKHRRRPVAGDWPPGEWNIAGVLGMTEVQFWAPLDESFWETLPLTREALDVVHMVERWFGKTNVCLLTSPPRNPKAAAGKQAWIQTNFPNYSRRFFIGSAKYLCAGPAKFLIDDNADNVLEFNAAGGTAILFPRPWNPLHDLIGDPVKFVDSVLAAHLGKPAEAFHPMYEQGTPL